MNNTGWKFPNTITQFAEHPSHISWENLNQYAGAKSTDQWFLRTSTDLVHLVNPSVNNIRSYTYYLQLKDFRIPVLSSLPTGIEVQLTSKRGGRETDETVQFRLNDSLLGENRADRNLDMIKNYGGPADFWGLTQEDLESISDSEFSLLLRFQSHPQFPHRDAMYIDSVAVRVWY